MDLKKSITLLLEKNRDSTPERVSRYFKTKKGEYAYFDQFIGVSAPKIKQLSRQYTSLKIQEIEVLLTSLYNEIRYFSLYLLKLKYQKGSASVKKEVFDCYLKNLQYINNWNLIDMSCSHIVGDYLINKNKNILYKLSQSKNLWERRIAMVSTQSLIKQNEFNITFQIALSYLNDPEDLIHKATGWMLREIGKKDNTSLLSFLDHHAKTMPRVMLRYALEKQDTDTRQRYLKRLP